MSVFERGVGVGGSKTINCFKIEKHEEWSKIQPKLEFSKTRDVSPFQNILEESLI